MPGKIYSVISGTGSYLPEQDIENDQFLEHSFYYQGKLLDSPTGEVIERIEQITEIKRRRYILPDMLTSDMAAFAAQAALEDAAIDPEELDHIIVAHNFGDVAYDNRRTDMVPSLAARVKHRLGIKSPKAVAYDVIFGCPGWLQGLIQADYYIRSGDAQKILVIGAEALSRVADPNDRNCLLYSDGAGAVVVEARDSEAPIGILGHQSRTDTFARGEMLWMDTSCKTDGQEDQTMYLKMNGRNVYKYSLNQVPILVKSLLTKLDVPFSAVKKVLIHQANGKMVKSIVQRLLDTEGVDVPVEQVLPLTVSWLGNNSVATVPILLDLLKKGRLDSHQLGGGDLVLFCTVGAGMNINALLYRVPE